MTNTVPRAWFFVLFTISGFSGLIYESIWSHYLKLFLGHAAYAQTLVLAIFMGGMAIGSWICSKFSARWRNLLVGYAVAEAAIGLCALVFHQTFVAFTDFAYDSAMPALASPLAVNAFKWALSALLILPQSVLLGMTFPLMTAGVIRAHPAESGGTIAMLYFTNSLGAAAGVLASGFWLIARVGLPGTLLTAGLINLVLAGIVWLLSKNVRGVPAPESPRVTAAAPRAVHGYRLMLTVSLLTGAASFMYEIGWIRMLSMVLGGSTQAFELMLSAFILGLAFGGLWIKRRIDRAAAPERTLGIIQVAMGLLALATLVVYGQTFGLMQTLLETVARTDEGYAAFNFGSHLIALLVMFPAAFCAGMTLPLITHVLLRRGTGERAIGAVYAANMIGAILGVFAAVHIGMPVLGLKGLITLGAGIDIGLGLLLLWGLAQARALQRFAAAVGVAAVAATLAFVELDSYKMASGVYRRGVLYGRDEAKLLYHRDGKAATINVLQLGDRMVITTNGKPDAAINPDPKGRVVLDETTMVLTGALPIALHPQARAAANIGFGSGVSGHVMLASATLQVLDNIEIEPAIIEGARAFTPRNDSVYRDPRSRIHIEDAKTFFSLHNKRYDIIVSEPSNPWVSGVASLFTDEFYGRVKQHLNRDGVFIQWLQLYEINPLLVASVFKALSRHFSHYEVYAPNDLDIIIAARDGGPLPPPSQAVFAQPAFAAELARIQIHKAADLDLHRVGPKAALQPYFDSFRIPANSDYFPILDQRAAKARFMHETASDVTSLATMPLPALEFLGASPARRDFTVTPRRWLNKSEALRVALEGRAYLLDGGAERLAALPSSLRSDFELVRLFLLECARPARSVSVDQLSAIAGALVPFLSTEEMRPVWSRLQGSACAAQLGDRQRRWLALYAAVSERNTAEMAQLAEGLLRSSEPDAVARKDYLFATAVVGRLAGGEREQAAAIWREFAHQLVSNRRNMLPDLLRGHVLPALAAH